MDPVTIISLALTGMKYLTTAIEAANAGDLAAAQTALTAARDHYAQAAATWEAAATPSQEKAPDPATGG